MNITVKPKIEATDQFNIRIPVSVKKRLEALRTRAVEIGADFNATFVGVIEEFATELESRFDLDVKAASTNPTKVLARPAPSTSSSRAAMAPSLSVHEVGKRAGGA